MEQAPLNYTLGLDIGMASVGAALLAKDHILALHVRAFDKAETPEKGEPLNKTRRDARSLRRRLRRRAHRLLRLRRLFKREGLISSPSPDELKTTVSPWNLRAEGLDRKLDPREWAAVLYHIVKHRGFQSNRKSEAATDEQAGKMLDGVKANQQRMEEGGWRTVGEMVARDPRFATAKRNKGGSYSHTLARADLEHELGVLFEAQRGHANPHTSNAFEEAVYRLLMERRPTIQGGELLHKVGRCTFEPNEYRAPKASHTAERFVWLSRLNSLRISDQGSLRGLQEEERKALLELPFTQRSVKYKHLRTLLQLPDTARFVGLDYWKKRKEGNELAAEDAVLFEAKAFHALRMAYEKAGLKQAWQRDAMDPDRLDTLASMLTIYKDDASLRQAMTEKGIEPVIMKAVLSVSFTAFIRLSLKALRKIIPFMEAGMRYDEAVQAAGYGHHSDLHANTPKSHKLPALNKEDFPNPVVYRALNQARKVVNAIIDTYGSPSAIHIELARDLNKPWDERRNIEREQKAFAEHKDTLVKKFRGRFEREPRKDELLKMRLYDEQQAKCAYSLRPLDLGRLLEDGYVEIDHALPYSRSFDDSLNNKALVLTEENRNKGNRTPFEYLGGGQGTERWRHFKAWVESNPNYRPAKRDRLLRKDFDEKAAEAFRERHLNDTRYIARAFKTFIEAHLKLAGENNNERCVVVSGQLTAFLRTRWGLNKNRGDGDLHHALDAAVVAAASRSMVKRLADYSRRKELELVRSGFIDPETGEVADLEALRRLEAQFPTPWPHFRQELEAWLTPDPALHLEHIAGYDKERAKTIQPIRVSRAPQRRNLGAAHEETIRSARWIENERSTVKTPLEKLKIKDIENIVGYDDPRNKALIDALRQRLEEHGGDGKKAFKEPFYKPSKPGKAAPQVRSVKLLDTQKSGIRIRGGIANNGDMLRVDIFMDKKNRFHAVPLYVADAVMPELPNRAVISGKSEKDWTVMDENYSFLFSLHRNDWVKVCLKDKTLEGYFIKFDRSTGNISLLAHDRNPVVGEGGVIRTGIKTALTLEKYHVDVLGKLYRVRQETRKPLPRPRKGG